MTKTRTKKESATMVPTNTAKTTETVLAELPPEGRAILALGECSPLFQQRYGKKLIKYAQNAPSADKFDELLDVLTEDPETEELGFALGEVRNQNSTDRDGIFSEDSGPMFPELRIFHGTGNDPMRPEETRQGHFYLTTQEEVGETFEGAVLAIWRGRTMWPPQDDSGSGGAPICVSMNRIIGSTCGICQDCPDEPWKDGKKTGCNDDVVGFFLDRSYKRIVLVRFQKSSKPAGDRLVKLLSVSAKPWAKWWKLSLEAQTKGTKKWYVTRVAPGGGETREDRLTPKAIHPFCQALSDNLSGTFILPGIARTYVQAAEVLGEVNNVNASETSAGSSAAGGPMTEEDVSKNDERYDEMPEGTPDDA